MIPVALAPEPPIFEAKVRRRGMAAIAELIGKEPAQQRRGRKRKPEMRSAYGGLCAYLAMYIEPATGAPSVDHVVPRAKSWKLVYEWSNYRMAAAIINSKKSDLDLVLDPFAIKPGLFALELVSFQVVPGSKAKGTVRGEVDATIELLGLNMPECCQQRGEYVESYEAGDIELSYLERRAPFIAQELRRQGWLRRRDQ